MQEFNPSSEHNLVKESVIKAGKLALKWFKKDPEQWKKDDGTLVSKADIEINDLLNKSVSEKFNSHELIKVDLTNFEENRQNPRFGSGRSKND